MMWKIEGRRRRGRQRMRWLGGITDSMDMSLSKLWELGDGQGTLVCCSPRGCKESDMTEWLNWTELMSVLAIFSQMYTQCSCKQKIREVIQQWGKNRGRNTKIGSWEDAKMTNQDANSPPLVDDTLRQREGRRINAPRLVGGSVDWLSLYRRETWPPLW